MGNISKKAGGPIRADEVGWEGLKKNPKADADAALLDLGLGGGVMKPIPVFTDETTSWTIYPVTSTEDDDKPGIYCLTVWDVPHDTMGLKMKYCYVKADGTYGRVRWFPSYRLDDDERSAGRVEVQFGPLRPNSRIDIVRAVAVKRAAKDVGNPGLDEEDRRGKGTTPAYAPEAVPPTIGITAYWGDYDGPANDQPFANRIRFTSGPNALATILTKNYIISSPRILEVGNPKKEVDGVYFPVTFGVTNGAELLTSSIRMGIYRVGTKAGGATAYSKRIPVPRYDLTEEDRDTLSTAGRLTIDVGPLKANKRYHIRWARARYSLDPDDSGAKTIRVRHPAEYFASGTTPPDLSLDYISTDIADGGGNQWSRDNVTGVDPDGALIPIPGNNDGVSPDPSPNTTSGPQLAVLAPTGDITDPPSDPNASDIITNEPDDATEKDKDAIIVLRVWAAEGNRAKYLIDPSDPTMVTWSEANVNRAAVVIKTLLPDGVTYKQRRHGIDIEDPDAVFVDITFHRQIGKPLVWVKNVSLNEADRDFSSTIDLALTAGIAGSLSSVSLVITNDGDDNRQADAAVTLTYSGGFAVPKRIVIMRGTAATGSPANSAIADINAGVAGPPVWKPVFKKNLRADSEQLAVATPPVLNFNIQGVTAAAGNRWYKAYVFVIGQTNAVSSSAVLNTGDPADTGVSDTVVPPDPLAAPTIRHRHGHLRAKIARPDASIDGNKLIYKWEWQFSSNIGFVGNGTRTFLQDNDTTPIVAPIVGNEPEIESSGVKLSIPIKRADFSTWETGVTNLYCRVRPYNHIGVSAGWSPILTHAIGSKGASLDDVEDIAVPATVAAPTARYKDGTLRFKCVKPASGINTLDYYEWQISNDPAFSTGAGIYYIQDNDTTLVTASSSTIQSENRKLVIPATRTDLALLVPVSGSTARRPVLNFRVRGHNRSGVDDGNGAGNAVWSSAGTLTFSRADGDVNRHGAIGRANMVDGGGFMSSRNNYELGTSPTNQPGRWWKYRLVSGMSGGAYRIETTFGGTSNTGATGAGTSATKWDAPNHQLDFGYDGVSGAGIGTLVHCGAATKIRRQIIGANTLGTPTGEVYSLTFFLKSATSSFNPGTLVVALAGEDGVSVGSQSITFSGGASDSNPPLGTSYRAYRVKFAPTALPTVSGWVYFLFNNASWATAEHVYLDNVCLVRGNQPMLFESSAADIAVDESSLVSTFANGTELLGDDGGNGDDGISTWGYIDV